MPAQSEHLALPVGLKKEQQTLVGKGFPEWNKDGYPHVQTGVPGLTNALEMVFIGLFGDNQLQAAVLPTPIDAVINFSPVIRNDSSKANPLPQSYEGDFEVMTGMDMGLLFAVTDLHVC